MNKNIEISEYNYTLPEDRIAKYPPLERDSSKLLLYNKGKIITEKFSDITLHLPKDSLLVFNNTKVIRARLEFRKATGARIEIFCLEPHKPSEYTLALQQTTYCEWKCLIGNSKKWKKEKLVQDFYINNEKIELFAERTNEDGVVAFSWKNNDIAFSEILHSVGKVPIPPYLNRDSEEIDKLRYQTIVSKHEGSVAAPTAALHFSEKTINQLKALNIKIDELTLHVGAGTFRPVLTENVASHNMHKERVFVSRENLENILKYHGEITAVGTTSVRTMESLYWLGVKILNNHKISLHNFTIEQWEAYNLPQEISVEESLAALISNMEKSNLTTISGETGIMIVPGYKFRIINRLVTNFHQPKSTLLLLIAAFVGEDWKKIYNYALKNEFRFLSYGDSSLLIPE